MLVVVDYGLGNIRSILHKLHKLKIEARVGSTLEEIEQADKIILPGVGNFATGIKNIHNYGLINILSQKVLLEKTPILGICLGMQLFAKKSEEGYVNGLGWINAEIKKIDFTWSHGILRIPHVGWNNINIIKTSPLLEGISPDSRFYFTHSYYLAPDDKDMIVAKTYYGQEFSSVIQNNNIYGTQFHPEKSHKAGMKIIQNFFENC